MLQYQNVDSAFAEGIKSICGGVDNWFASQVERRIEQHWNSRRLAKFLNDSIIAWILFFSNSLEASGTHVVDGADAIPFAFIQRQDKQHIASRVLLSDIRSVEKILGTFF